MYNISTKPPYLRIEPNKMGNLWRYVGLIPLILFMSSQNSLAVSGEKKVIVPGESLTKCCSWVDWSGPNISLIAWSMSSGCLWNVSFVGSIKVSPMVSKNKAQFRTLYRQGLTFPVCAAGQGGRLYGRSNKESMNILFER